MKLRSFRAVVALGALALVGCDDNDEPGPGEEPPVPRLDASTIPKYQEPLLVPPVMPPTGVGPAGIEYRVAARQFEQQMLPPPLPITTVWGYGRAGDPLPGPGVSSTFSYPGPTFEVRSFHPVRVTWINGLVDESGGFLPPLLPVDSTIHWADPGHDSGGDSATGGGGGGGGGGHHVDHGHDHDHDHMGDPEIVNERYIGPVPIVTHVHGSHSFSHSDGLPEAWYLPKANNIPKGYERRGPRYASQAHVGLGAAVFDYPIDEDAATLWYHDHALGMTRVNVYAGLAGFWLIRDQLEDSLNLPGPGPTLNEPPGTKHYEIPLAIADRAFTVDGALWYPNARSEYGDYDGPVFPDSDVPPIWGPEFFGDAMVVNGRTWPYLEVEPRLYRFRMLNASDARTLILNFGGADVSITLIGVDGGFVSAAPVPLDEIRLGPAERVDVIVDFSRLAVGTSFLMRNTGPDVAWAGPDANPPQEPADPDTTGQVMQFRVVEHTDHGNEGTVPTSLPVHEPLVPDVPPRDLLLAEQLHQPGDVSIHVLLGTVTLGPLPWAATPTEIVRVNDTEAWRLINTTPDAHPIHLHLVDFEVRDRTPFDADAFKAAEAAWLAGIGPEPVVDDFVTGPAEPAPPGEAFEKDTVLAYPGMITRLIAKFDRVGVYVWHCHIIEHEDNDMMRPLLIVPGPTPP